MTRFVCAILILTGTVAVNATDWPVFHANPALTGVTTNTLPSALELRWRFKAGDAIKSSPVIAGDRVFIGSDDHKVYALSLKTGNLVWSHTTSNAVEAAPLALDGTVYAGSTDGNLYALDATTGKLKWKYTTDAKIPGAANYFRAGNSLRILVGSHDNSLHCVNAATGKAVWTFDTSNYINGAPAIADGKIVFGGCDGQLHLLDLAGKELADIEAGAYIPGSAAVAGGQAFVGHYGCEVICADLTRTNVLWRYKGREAFFSSPAVTDKLVLIGGRDKRLHCLDRATGKELWAFQTRDEVDCSPVVSADKVIFGSSDGRIYLVSLATGKELWSYDIGKPVTGSPAVADGLIIIGAEDGVVYAFGEKIRNPNNQNPKIPFRTFVLVSDLLRMSRRLGFDIRIRNFPHEDSATHPRYRQLLLASASSHRKKNCLEASPA